MPQKAARLREKAQTEILDLGRRLKGFTVIGKILALRGSTPRTASGQTEPQTLGLALSGGLAGFAYSEKFAVFDPLGNAPLEAEPHAVAAVALR